MLLKNKKLLSCFFVISIILEQSFEVKSSLTFINFFCQIPDLRKKSRRDYVKKRRVDQLEMLQEDILDDEYLFENAQLSKREKQDREYKKKVYSLAVEHAKAGELEKVQRYEMPQENKKPAKYDDTTVEELGPNYEQKKWEQDKLDYAVMKFGAKDAKQKSKV